MATYPSHGTSNWDPALKGYIDAVPGDAITAATQTGGIIKTFTDAAYASRQVILDAVTEGTPNDGVTNAQSALGVVHNMLPSTGGRILLRRGSYLMTTRLIVTKQGLVLEGEGIDATVMLLSVAGFQVGASDVLVKNMTIKANVSTTQQLFQLVTTGAFKNWRFENVRFQNLGVTVGKLGAVDFNGTALTSAAGLDSHVEFDHCEITGYTEDGCLYVRGTQFVTVGSCWFHDLGTDQNKGDALKFSYGAEEWSAIDNTFENCKRDAIDCYDGQRGVIERNKIMSPGVHGVEMKVVSGTAPNPSDRNRVTNNHIINPGSSGGGIQAPGIQCATNSCTIQGNLIEGGTYIGIRAGKMTDGVTNTHDTTIIGNRVIGAASHGIYVSGVDRPTVIGNTARACGGSGYTVTGNTSLVGGASLNQSSGNTSADVWV